RLHPVHEIDELGDPQSVLAAQIFMPRGDAGVDQRDADAGAVVPEVLADGRAPIVAAVASIVPRTERSSEICAMWGLCERPTSAAFGTTAARELMMPSLRPATPPARAIAGPTSSSDARSTARMITRDSPVPSAACARTIGPSFNPGSDGCVAAEGAITPKDSTAASATGKVVREATCDAPLPALRAAGRRSEPEPGTFFMLRRETRSLQRRGAPRKNKIADVLTAQRFSDLSRSRYCHGAWVWHALGYVRKRFASFYLVFALTLSHGIPIAAEPMDQQQLNSSGGGSLFNSATWVGQTFVAGVSGVLTRLDVSLFCFLCGGTNPDIIVEVRTASGGLPTPTVLATATLKGFASASSTFYSAVFTQPAILTAG